MPAAMGQQGVHLGFLDGPAGGVAGRVDDQQPGPGRQRGQQAVQVQVPAAFGGRQRHPHHLGTQHPRHLADVGPQRRDGDHPVAGREQQLHRHHQAGVARGDHADAGGVQRPAMQAPQVGGDGLAQIGPAQVLAVEGLARVQRLHRRRADVVGVGWSDSPNQKGSTSARPMALLATSRMSEPASWWTADGPGREGGG
jgi:hypothetical protein